MWGGFHGARGGRIAGRAGIGLLAIDRRAYQGYLRGLEEGGHDLAGARMKASLNLVVAEDPEAAWSRIRPHFGQMYDTYFANAVMGTDRPAPPPMDPDSWRRRGPNGEPVRAHIVTPEDAIALITKLSNGRPLLEIYTFASIYGMPDDLVEEHVRLLCTTVGAGVKHLQPAVAEAASTGSVTERRT